MFSENSSLTAAGRYENSLTGLAIKLFFRIRFALSRVRLSIIGSSDGSKSHLRALAECIVF